MSKRLLLATMQVALCTSVPALADDTSTPAWYQHMASPPAFLNKESMTIISAEDMTTQPSTTPLASPAAPAPLPMPTAVLPNYIDAGINIAAVSHNYGNAFGEFIDGQYQTDESNRWSGQMQHQAAFHDSGETIGIGNMHVFNQDWYSDIGASTSSKATFLPQYRIDADINRKWLDNRNFITTFGVTWDKASEVYNDYGILLGATYYFTSPWVVQGGVRVNESTPGNVIAPSAFGAVTYGYEKHFFVTVHAGAAHEAYQILGSNNIVNAFSSQNVGVNWRQWLGDDWGVNLGSEYYTNPYYDRVGVAISIFKEF